MKVTGAEFHRFYNDPSIWTDGMYHENVVFAVNGVEVDDIPESINDTDIVSFSGGFIANDNGDAIGTFVGLFRKWRKKQMTVMFVVECHIDKEDYIKQCVRDAGGTVKC